MHVFGLWEEAEVLREKPPNAGGESANVTQKTGIWTTAFSLEGECANHYTTVRL